MTIDRKKVKNVFKKYTDNYDTSDEKIKLKVDHTYRVAALSERIARSLGLGDDDTNLAWLIGMLHDIGRFEQLKNYGTFSDAESIDHAHYGVELLFEDGIIYYGCANIAKRSYLLFTLTSDDYMYEVVNF